MVTGEQVREACLAAGIKTVDHHECSLCGFMTHYSIEDEVLFFNPGCDCTWRDRRPSRWQEAADWINMQTSDEHRIRIGKLFGLDSPSDRPSDAGLTRHEP